jgi:Family of unknown function (DUF6200)
MAATPATTPGRNDVPARPATTTNVAPPVVLDLGKQRRKRIKQLRRGEGRLMDEVNGSVEELRTAGAIGADAQAVVIIVREKRRKTRGLSGLLQD